MFEEVYESPGCGQDWVSAIEVGRLHCGGLVHDVILLGVYEDGDCPSLEKDLGGVFIRDDTLFFMKLHVLEAGLDCPPVGIGLHVLI